MQNKRLAIIWESLAHKLTSPHLMLAFKFPKVSGQLSRSHVKFKESKDIKSVSKGTNITILRSTHQCLKFSRNWLRLKDTQQRIRDTFYTKVPIERAYLWYMRNHFPHPYNYIATQVFRLHKSVGAIRPLQRGAFLDLQMFAVLLQKVLTGLVYFLSLKLIPTLFLKRDATF